MEEEEDDSEDKGNTEPGLVFTVKLIDSAGTKPVAEEGPDEGVLLGLHITLRSLDGEVPETKPS